MRIRSILWVLLQNTNTRDLLWLLALWQKSSMGPTDRRVTEASTVPCIRWWWGSLSAFLSAGVATNEIASPTSHSYHSLWTAFSLLNLDSNIYNCSLQCRYSKTATIQYMQIYKSHHTSNKSKGVHFSSHCNREKKNQYLWDLHHFWE